MSFIYLLFYREELFVFAHVLCFMFEESHQTVYFPLGFFRLKVYGVVLVLSRP